MIVTFKTALLAKELGFDDLCDYTYTLATEQKFSIELTDEGVLSRANRQYKNSEFTVFITAPSQEILQEWLRKVYNIDVWAKPFMVVGRKEYLGYVDFNPNKGEKNHFVTHKTNEEAIEYGLMTALEQIKSHKD